MPRRALAGWLPPLLLSLLYLASGSSPALAKQDPIPTTPAAPIASDMPPEPATGLPPEGDWAEPTVLFHHVSLAKSQTVPLNQPSIVADPAGGLHVFWSVKVPVEESAIFYTAWDGDNWSQPVDVLVGPATGQANANASVVIDQQGFLHVIWSNDRLYYSRAHVTEAGSAQGWLPPVEVGPWAFNSEIFVDGEQVLHLVYSVLGGVGDVFHRWMRASGTQWSQPVNVSNLPGITESTGNPDVIVTLDGTIHVAWGQYQLPDGWPPTGVYYSRSSDGGLSWSQRFQLGGDNHGAPSLASLSDRELHTVWLTTGGEGRYYSRSLDGGESWDIPRQLTSDVQFLIVGSPQFALDGADRLHLVMGGSQGEDLIFYSRRDGQGWQPLERITKASQRLENAPDVAVTNGNRLHVVWVDIAVNDVSYTWRPVDAPHVPSGSLPSLETTSLPTPAATPIAAPSPTPVPASSPIGAFEPYSEPGATRVWVIALVPVILLLLGVMAGALMLRRRP